ncbi:MAG TPA: T9SS type A sorting domain-containing protein, partial [Saprospiraceae bacterium]|nr:T9SS type A sorting domain-containing protein [Saprospiraceae bacterium]
IHRSTLDTTLYTTCDSFTWNNQTYTQTGFYKQSWINRFGCDSSVVLALTLRFSTGENMIRTSCDEFTINNQTYTQTGVYVQKLTNAAGCDSTLLLDLTIIRSSTHTIRRTACDSIVINNQSYTASGSYSQTLTNAVGCDSLLILELTIHPSSLTSVFQTACNSFTLNQETYTQTGVYTQVLKNQFFCDSTIVLGLTIIKIDTSVTKNGNTLVANASSGGYQWLDCDQNFAPISNQTNASFTPSVDGNYAVVINDGPCSDTSSCYSVLLVGTDDAGETLDVQYYPNPSDGKLNLFAGQNLNEATLRIANAAGVLFKLYEHQNGTLLQYDLSELPEGLYWLELTEGDRTKRTKWMKL